MPSFCLSSFLKLMNLLGGAVFAILYVLKLKFVIFIIVNIKYIKIVLCSSNIPLHTLYNRNC